MQDNGRLIYMDHAATTPLDPDVFEAMRPYFTDLFGNPSSIYGLGRKSMAAIDSAHDQVARVLNARPTEIVFTGGGSEADNLAIRGAAYARRARGNHIITSAIEHHAVLHTCQQLEREDFRITFLPVDENGLVSSQSVLDAITDDTTLVTIMYANNEVGTVQPISEIGEICRTRGGALSHRRRSGRRSARTRRQATQCRLTDAFCP